MKVRKTLAHPVSPKTWRSQPRGSAIQRLADQSAHTRALAQIQRRADARVGAAVVQRVDDDEAVQTKAIQRVDDDEAVQTKPIQRAEDTASSGGKSGLPGPLKSGIESLSGLSMDGVQVHRNSDKPGQVGAHAYAQGNDIHLAAGQEKHLPHEAWHVVQQAQGRVKPTMQLQGQSGVAVNDDAGLEKEADVMGAKAARYAESSDHG